MPSWLHVFLSPSSPSGFRGTKRQKRSELPFAAHRGYHTYPSVRVGSGCAARGGPVSTFGFDVRLLTMSPERSCNCSVYIYVALGALCYTESRDRRRYKINSMKFQRVDTILHSLCSSSEGWRCQMQIICVCLGLIPAPQICMTPQQTHFQKASLAHSHPSAPR